MIFARTLIAGRLLTLFLLGSLAVSGSALGTPTTYQITFTGLLSPLPTEAFFTYDPALVQSFSDFHVVWDGLDFNLADAANAPAIGGDCGAVAPPQLTFALLSHTSSKCASNSVVFAGFQGDQRFFSFAGGFDSNLNAYSLVIGVSIGEPCPPGICNIGGMQDTFDIAPTAVPGPSPLLFVITGLANLWWVRRYRLPSPCKVQ